MKLSVAERLLAAIAAVATLLAFVDTYFFSSRIVEALKLPQSLPTGVSILMFMCPAAIALLLVSRVARAADEIAALRSELASLHKDHQSSTRERGLLQEQLKVLQDEVSTTDRKAVQKGSFRKQMVALLATHYLDEEGLRAYLSVSSNDHDGKVLLREVISDLLSEGVIGSRGGGKYALRRLPKSSAE